MSSSSTYAKNKNKGKVQISSEKLYLMLTIREVVGSSKNLFLFCCSAGFNTLFISNFLIFCRTFLPQARHLFFLIGTETTHAGTLLQDK